MCFCLVDKPAKKKHQNIAYFVELLALVGWAVLPTKEIERAIQAISHKQCLINLDGWLFVWMVLGWLNRCMDNHLVENDNR